jgi:hypothetical protein
MIERRWCNTSMQLSIKQLELNENLEVDWIPKDLLEAVKRKVNISTSQRGSHQRRPSEDVTHIVTN